MDDGCAGAERCLDVLALRYDEARRAGKAVGLGLALKNSGLGNGFKEVTKAVVRFRTDGPRRGPPRVDRDGPGINTVWPCRWRSRNWASTRTASWCLSTRAASSARGRQPAAGALLMGAGAVRDACRAAKQGGCQYDVDYVRVHRVDWTHHLGEVESPIIHLGVRLRRAAGDRRPGVGRHRAVVAAHDVGGR